MARNQHAVIWTQISGKPQKMGDLLLSTDQSAFTYLPEYLETELPGFCLLGDNSLWQSDTVTYPISERIPVFPRLISLIPGNNPRNLQRRHYIDLLRAQQGREPAPGLDTEWRLLVTGGHGGIGHIDVFSDDITAQNWYQPNAHSQHELMLNASGNRSQLWGMLKHNVLDENVEFNPQIIEETLGPTPSVGGMIPKLLVSMNPNETAVNFYPPDTPDNTEVVLKIEPPEYSGLLDLEALCLDVHQQAGFDVPNYQRIDNDGLKFLAVERFDRQQGIRVPMESLFSVIATGDHLFRETADIMLDELGGIIARLSEVVSLPPDTGEALYRRLLMALLTGNGDMHLDNIALLGGVNDCRLTPVYDPAPMRAWPRHNLVSAIPFDASGYADRGQFFIYLGKTFGLPRKKIQDCIDQSLDATTSYIDQVMGLNNVPLQLRKQLAEICLKERNSLQRYGAAKF